MPQCTRCGLVKEWTEYHRQRGKFKLQCKACRSKYMAEYYLKNKAKILERVKKWQALHPKGDGQSRP